MAFGGSGTSIQADSYRQAAQATMQAASFNIGVLNNNLSRRLGDVSRQLHRTAGTQKAQAAGTGFSVASKSFRMIENETIDGFLSQANDLRKDAEYERQRIWYEAQVRAVNLENQARAAEEAGRRQQFQQMQGLLGGITRIFGGQ